MSSDEQPLISVIIPTYRRPDLLRRAIDSVLSQNYQSFELIVSDDEDPPGETWSWLQSLRDPRLRIIRNPGPHGQCGNVNHAMRQARALWIKPLYDDDLLRPHCLAAFAQAVADQPGVVMASCAVAEFRGGRRVRSGESSGPLLVRLPQKYIHLAMYLQDDACGGVPSQLMVHRRILDAGVFFENHPQLRSGVDSLWCARVFKHGDSLAIHIPLVEFHQGEHESVTSTMSQNALDEEFHLLRRLQLPMIDPQLHPPSLQTIDQMLNLIRAANRASRKQYGSALKLMLKTWRPAAWWLALRWLLRRRWPGRFSSIPGIVLDDAKLRQIIQD